MTVCAEGRTDGRTERRTGDEEGLGNINGATATENDDDDDDVQTTEIGRLGEEGERESYSFGCLSRAEGGPILARMGVNSPRDGSWMCARLKRPPVVVIANRGGGTNKSPRY